MDIDAVYIWENGMVMTFDKNGEQVPEFQGPVDDIIPKLLESGVKLSEVLKTRDTWSAK